MRYKQCIMHEVLGIDADRLRLGGAAYTFYTLYNYTKYAILQFICTSLNADVHLLENLMYNCSTHMIIICHSHFWWL